MFLDDGGRDIVMDYRAGEDHLDLTAVSDLDSFSQLGLTQKGSSAEVAFETGSFMIFGATIDQLNQNQADFLL